MVTFVPFAQWGAVSKLLRAQEQLGDHPMNAIKKARKFIEQHPEDKDAATMARLVSSLESDSTFCLRDLYDMEYDHFELALSVMKDWRLDRYYGGKAKLLDIAAQMDDIVATMPR